jgi:hypothetical protein
MAPKRIARGTRVICINTRDEFYVDPSEGRRRVGSLDGLTEGRNYGVRCFRPNSDILGGYEVSVYEILRGREYRFGGEIGYAPQRFRVLEPVRQHVAVPQQEPVRVRELVDA